LAPASKCRRSVTSPDIPPLFKERGEVVITPALMMDMEDIILDRISFGGMKELEEIYAG
jgi:hypothetical protein